MNIEYDANKIFQMLVYSRILFPASKKKSYEQIGTFFERFGGLSMDDVYSALAIFGRNERVLQKWIYDPTISKYHRDQKTVF